jgi:hypothetical protein
MGVCQGEILAKLQKEGLSHGDVVDFGSYRGTGLKRDSVLSPFDNVRV